MHFSTIAVLLVGNVAASNLVARMPLPYYPRSLVARQGDQCMGLTPAGFVCCGANNGNANVCPPGQTCRQEGDYWWCCGGSEPNCARPATECGENNGGCEEGYTCQAGANGAGATCVPEDGATPPSDTTTTAAEEATSAAESASSAAETASSAADDASSAAAYASSAADSATSVVDSLATETPTGGAAPGVAPTDSSGNATAAPPEATSSGSKLGGSAMAALVIMAGIIML